MAEGVSASMSLVLRMVGDAIALDSQNRKKEAYCQYLSCCIYISQILKDDAWDKDLRTVYNKDVAKLFKLIQQCQERALNIISSESPHSLDGPPRSPRAPHTQPSQTLAPQPGNVRKYSDPLPAEQGQGHKQSSSDSIPGSPSTPPHYQGKPLKLPSPPSSQHISAWGRSPGDSLSSLYKPQPERSITGINLRVSRPGSVDKNLRTMRKMAENLLIAKAREDAIRKKVWERQQRLQMEANRRFSSAVAVSKEEQEQRLLYTKILEYEQDMVWPQQLREQLKRSPEDTALINNIINKIFSSKDHPLRQLLIQYQYHVYKKLLPLLKDVNFPDEEQVQDTNNVDNSQEASNSDVEQVESGRTGHWEGGVVENENENVQELNDEKGVCNDLESGEGYTAESLDSRESKEENYDAMIDGDAVDLITKNAKENISTHNSDDNEEVLENTIQEDEAKTKSNSSDLDDDHDDINKNKSLKDSDDSQETIDVDDDCSKSKDNYNVQQLGCESKTMKGELSYNENIAMVVYEILEDLLTQIVEDETTENLDESKNSENDDSHLVLKPADSVDSGVDGVSKDSNLDTTNRTLISKNSLLKIDSFDLESEFRSLEDDMFQSESSEDEGEGNEEDISMGRLDVDFNQDVHSNPNTEPQTSMEIRTNTAEEMKRNVETEDAKHEFCDKSEEKEIDRQLDPEKVVSENMGSGVGGIDGSTGGGDNDSTPAVDLETTRKQLNEIFVDMRFFLEKLKEFIILAYEELATPTGHDQCYAAVEYPFFQPLWPLLLGVLRRVNFDKEISLGTVMTKRIHSKPSDMGVVDRLCLLDKESLEATGNVYPYQIAVEQLHKIATSCCPLEKLECLVRASRNICQCVEDYWEWKGKPRHCSETSIGCDDLLPIFTYVIVKSGMAQLISETSAMEEFIPEGYLMGEEGYCLTTLQTALAYLVTLDCP